MLISEINIFVASARAETLDAVGCAGYCESLKTNGPAFIFQARTQISITEVL
jgi:hypothetical protein